MDGGNYYSHGIVALATIIGLLEVISPALSQTTTIHDILREIGRVLKQRKVGDHIKTRSCHLLLSPLPN